MIRFAATLALAAALTAGASAQRIAVGNFNGWVAAQPANTMLDDGVAPDAAAGDGIYTITVTDNGGSIGDNRGVKVTGPGGWGDNEVPSGVNHDYRLTSVPQNVTVYLDTNAHGDGWIPSTNILTTSSPQPFTTLTAVGGFQGWNNMDPATVMTDNGTDPNDTAGDGIYTLTIQIATAGSQSWKAIYDNDWGRAYAAQGFCNGGTGNDLTFNTTIANEVVILQVNTNTMRARAQATGTTPAELSVFSAD